MIKNLTIFVVILLVFGAMTYKILHQGEFDCQVCINYKGRAQCSRATGPNEGEAQLEAHRSACSVIAAGVTETLECDRISDESVSCSPRK